MTCRQEAPERWTLKRLRFVADINPSKGEMAPIDRETEVSFVPMEAVGDDGTLSLDRTRPVHEVENGYTYFRDGDVAFAKITPCFENGKGAIMRGLVGGIGFGTTELTVVRPKPSETTAEFLNWLLTSVQFRGPAEGAMYGAGGQKRVPDDFVRNFLGAFPPLHEQAAIADFLDRETGKIDALVEQQERLIELLKEKRQAVVSHAVTKGLNPDAPMKDTGIEWLGEVPEHWEIRRLSSVAADLQTGPFGSQLHSTDYVEGGTPVVNPSNLVDGRIIPNLSNTVDGELVDALAHHRLAMADIVIGRRGEMGRCALVTEEAVGWLCGTGSLRVRLLDTRLAHFVCTYLRTPAIASFLSLMSVGSTMDNLNTSILGQTPIPLPPVDEAHEIVAFLVTGMSELDRLCSEAERGIELLLERRAALISAAVTGKIDVRNYAAADEAAA